MATSTTAGCAPAQPPPPSGPVCQRYPRSGPLAESLNLDRDELVRRIGDLGGTVYCYVVATVRDVGGAFAQVGTGPNFEGGLVTLCTCKGQMRAGRDINAWPGTWVAGVTGAGAGPLGKGHLFYLMRVEYAFASHRELWDWLMEHAPAAARAKAADKHPLGDVFRPGGPSGNPYDPSAYIPPRPDHSHRDPKRWHKDVDERHFGRWSALLVGDPRSSFLWSEPRVPLPPPPFHVGRGCKIVDLATLLGEAGVG